MNERITGTVKWYSPAKGYGFIARSGESDVFFYRTEAGRLLETLVDREPVDWHVEFELGVDAQSRTFAKDVRVARIGKGGKHTVTKLCLECKAWTPHTKTVRVHTGAYDAFDPHVTVPGGCVECQRREREQSLPIIPQDVQEFRRTMQVKDPTPMNRCCLCGVYKCGEHPLNWLDAALGDALTCPECGSPTVLLSLEWQEETVFPRREARWELLAACPKGHVRLCVRHPRLGEYLHQVPKRKAVLQELPGVEEALAADADERADAMRQIAAREREAYGELPKERVALAPGVNLEVSIAAKPGRDGYPERTYRIKGPWGSVGLGVQDARLRFWMVYPELEVAEAILGLAEAHPDLFAVEKMRQRVEGTRQDQAERAQRAAVEETEDKRCIRIFEQAQDLEPDHRFTREELHDLWCGEQALREGENLAWKAWDEAWFDTSQVVSWVNRLKEKGLIRFDERRATAETPRPTAGEEWWCSITVIERAGLKTRRFALPVHRPTFSPSQWKAWLRED